MRSLWGWYARRRGWTKLLLAAAAIPLLAAGLYAAGRTLQFASAEKDAGVFAPSRAQAVVRLRDLEGHWARIQKTRAWLALRKRVLRDPAIRRPVNEALRGAGLPSLDDLEDVRKAGLYSEENLLRGGGRDLMAAVQAADTPGSIRWCVATRLRWSDYLLAPAAHLVLPGEPLGGRSARVLRQGKGTVYVVLEGALAIASNDRALLEDALRRKGAASAPARPVEARVEFRDSRMLLDFRRLIARSGLAPQVKMETARALEGSIDVAGKEGEALDLDLLFAGAEATVPTPPPHALAGFAPPYASGALVSQIGVQDLYAWLQSLVDQGEKESWVSENARQAVEQLEKSGFTRLVLPRLERGMALLTGTEEREGRLYPTFALVVASPDGAAACEAITSVVKSIAGNMAQKQFRQEPFMDTTMSWWEWPRGVVGINDFLQPSYAPIEGGLVFGNNEQFTRSVVQASKGGETFRGERLWRDLQAKLKSYGLAPEPGSAGGWAHLPRVRESLDGLLPRIASLMTDVAWPDKKIGEELDRDLQQQGRRVTPEERLALFRESRERKVAVQAEELTARIRAFTPMNWIFFESRPTPRGVTTRIVAELR